MHRPFTLLRRLFLLTGILLMLLMLAVSPALAQDPLDSPVEMQVEAGYESFFRPDNWFPVRVTVRNQGADLTGRITVRPESSDRVVSNAYSTPIDLPGGSAKTAFLYIQARTFPATLTVELLTDDDLRAAQERVIITAIDARDSLHVVITGGDTEGIALNTVHTAGFNAQPVRWSVDNIPDQALALDAVDTIWINGIDSEALTLSQLAALENWTISGGHLVVFGGPGWEGTAARLTDLLPLVPEDSQSVDDVTPLARLAQDYRARLSETTIVTTGTLRDSARALAQTDDGLPLVARWQQGAGTVDYVTLDPSLEPLQSWDNLPDLWRHLAFSTDPNPAWVTGFKDKQQAAAAMSTLPGIDLLPPVSSMLLFLAAYVILIGPVNYFVLSRINRRGFAWVTIPILIVIFTGLAWSVGFNLRGNEVIISRLNVVTSWDNTDRAKLEQLVSLLAPRRGVYDMAVEPGRFLRVMPGLSSNSLLAASNTQSTADIIQTDQFVAEGVSVDGGIFSNFNATGIIEKPAISGRMTLVYERDGQRFQGIVRNDSDVTLRDPVLLARGVAYRLDDIPAGDFITVDSVDIPPGEVDTAPAPAGLQLSYESIDSLRETAFYRRAASRTQMDILGELENEPPPGSLEADYRERRRALLAAYTPDQFGSTGRGHEIYLAAWSDEWAADDVNPGDITWREVNTTLYLVQLAVEIETPPPSETVTIQQDQFTMVTLETQNTQGVAPNDLTMLTESAAQMRFMPVQGAVLDDVEQITIFIDRASSYGRQFDVLVWSHATREWVDMGDTRLTEYVIDNPDPYLGPDNAVEIRLQMDIPFGSAWIRHIGIQQTGSF